MTEYLILTDETAADRSALEGMQRGVGLNPGDVSQYWHGWITHPLTGEEALEINNEADKAYFSAAELAAIIDHATAAAADWFQDFSEAQ